MQRTLLPSKADILLSNNEDGGAEISKIASSKQNIFPTRRPASRIAEDNLLLKAILVIFLLSIAILIFVTPAPIPDTYTSTGATTSAEVNDWTSVGHSFRTERDGLYRIEVPLSTLKTTNATDIQFFVREEPKGPNLRALRVNLANLPEGEILDIYSTRWQDLPWVVFEFEPLYGYEGKQLYFNIEGKGIQKENTVQALFAYPNKYEYGEAFKAEQPANAQMVFRTYTRGNVVDLLGTIVPLPAKVRLGFLGWEWIYYVNAGAIAVLAATLFVLLARWAIHETQQ